MVTSGGEHWSRRSCLSVALWLWALPLARNRVTDWMGQRPELKGRRPLESTGAAAFVLFSFYILWIHGHQKRRILVTVTKTWVVQLHQILKHPSFCISVCSGEKWTGTKNRHWYCCIMASTIIKITITIVYARGTCSTRIIQKNLEDGIKKLEVTENIKIYPKQIPTWQQIRKL